MFKSLMKFFGFTVKFDSITSGSYRSINGKLVQVKK